MQAGEHGTGEHGTVSECAIANILEVFVEDDAFEGGAFAKRHLSD